MNHPATGLAHEPSVEIVVPVYNEERDLEPSVRRLHAYLESFFPFPALVTIADNASTDATPGIGARLAAELSGVRYLRLEEKGRGRALAAAWSESDADVVAYMDVDLSTGLEALLPLVAPLISGHSDLAIGSRLAAGAHVRRGPRREVISRVQPAAAARARGPLPRRAVRLQGGARRRRPEPGAARAGPRLVLRHRVARACGARGTSDP
jgi:glycosyltransferase involved in cell wall biosynthesis